MKHGRLTIVEIIKGRPAKCICKCDCGVEKLYFLNNVRSGKSKSCGCFITDTRHLNNMRHGLARKGEVSSEWQTWSGMKRRCKTEKGQDFFRYKARGILVCARWLIGDGLSGPFECFIADMGMKPTPNHTIDRINNDGNYEPSNCRWATRKQQANNRGARGSRNMNLDAINSLKNRDS